MTGALPAGRPATAPDPAQALGVLLVNLGTPAAPTSAALRRYLEEFLSDPRVVAIPRIIWLPLLHGLILRTRPRASAQRYQAIWTPEGSPLAVHTRRQSELLQLALPECEIEYAMRYGGPSIAQGLERLANCRRRLVIPLYPQYAGSTTEAVRDCLPAGTRMIGDFHAHPAYISALAAGVTRYWAAHGQGDILLMSFHGLPQRAVDRGDPYKDQCLTTARLLAEALGLPKDACRISFQSRFGKAAWIAPYTASLVQELGSMRTKRLDVLCPGFVSDCLETLEEIQLEAKKIFLDSGGTEFHLLPCLNESPEWISALAEIVRESGSASAWQTLP